MVWAGLWHRSFWITKSTKENIYTEDACSQAINVHVYVTEPKRTGINTGLSIAGSSGGGNQTCPSTLVLFSMHTLEILGRENQPQGWEIPMLPTL